MEEKKIQIPIPIIDEKEDASIGKLHIRAEKLANPKMLARVGKKITDVIPQSIKNVGTSAGEIISEQALYADCMKVVSEGFDILEKQAAKFTINEEIIVKKINEASKNVEITSVDEICLARSYDIVKLVQKHKTLDLAAALVEGAGTGYFGFWGLPFNLVFSTFLYYRAVQLIAMYYGYDVKNDPSELVMATEIFSKALSPNSQGADGVTRTIEKIMFMSEITTVKQLTKKTWAEMAGHGGCALLICQMRALANHSAKKALEKAGKKGLEETLFKGVFKQVGKNLTKKTAGKMVPVAGAFLGALFDVTQMNSVLEYADVFYNKRYLLEKEARINTLLGICDFVDVEMDDKYDDVIIEN